jgi:sortase B
MKLIKNILNVILVLIIVLCIYKIAVKQIDYYKANKENNNIQKIMEIQKPNENLLNKEKELSSINSDYKFWIKIPGTEVNYPVVQTDNNSYYLHHNFKNEESIEGNLFIYNKYNENSSRNILVFGHNMRNGSMFGSLWPYKDTNFFNNNKYIYIIQGDYIYKYEIFGDAVVNADNPYLKVNFKNQEEFVNYINDIKSKAYFWRDVQVNEDTKLLTLSTCSYEFDNARFVIISKLISKNKVDKTELVKVNSTGKTSKLIKFEYMLKEYYLIIILAVIILIALGFIYIKLRKRNIN